jgi:hypothetical protein
MQGLEVSHAPCDQMNIVRQHLGRRACVSAKRRRRGDDHGWRRGANHRILSSDLLSLPNLRKYSLIFPFLFNICISKPNCHPQTYCPSARAERFGFNSEAIESPLPIHQYLHSTRDSCSSHLISTLSLPLYPPATFPSFCSPNTP